MGRDGDSAQRAHVGSGCHGPGDAVPALRPGEEGVHRASVAAGAGGAPGPSATLWRDGQGSGGLETRSDPREST